MIGLQNEECKYIIKGLSNFENSIRHDAVIKKQCQDIKERLETSNDGNIIEEISELMCNLEFTELIARCFPKLVLQMVSHSIPLDGVNLDSATVDEKKHHLINCLVLGKLIPIHPDVLQYSLQYFHSNPSPFHFLGESQQISKKRRLNIDNNRNYDLDIAECCYAFLNVAPNIFRNKWMWSTFIEKYITNPEPPVRWLTCKCIAILSGMSEINIKQIENNVLDQNSITKCVLHYECGKDSLSSSTMGHSLLSSECLESISTNERVVNVSGVLLQVFNTKTKSDGLLVPVKSTQDNLRSLALSVATGRATCLVGPVGCGKTTLVEHLACVTGRMLRKVQLGDQTDSRTLLGTYRCTDIPGEFVWQPGVLTQAVQHGQWLLLEDIDCAAIDVASVLGSLLERNVLSVPGYRDAIPVSPGFQLFVTQRTVNSSTGQRQNSNASALLRKHWTQINIEPLSRQELVTIVETLYPKLKSISSRMVDVFMLFSAGSHHSSLHNIEEGERQSPLVKTLLFETCEILAANTGRLISTRDLIKWCSRSVINFDVTSQESALKVLQNALDLFTCSVSDRQSRIPLAKAIGAYLGIVETQAEYYCDSYKPLINIQPNSLHIGRVAVHRKEIPLSAINLQEKKVTFSFTRFSTCLLERIACCVNANEPVLLVGETGTGKTSTVQYLARETGNKLVVINMNQQSDCADLLGGYKPVDMKTVVSPIRDEFETLFRSYYDVLKNAKFLEYIAVAFESGNWKTLLYLMKQSQAAAVKRLSNTNIEEKKEKNVVNDLSNADKKKEFVRRWWELGNKLNKLELQLKSESSLAFSFIEGSLVTAIRKGYWVLLDEINLASAETLECLSGLLEGRDSSISLLERGDHEAIKRHKDFILFACMNPATDVGKRDLPAGLRNRFTEFFVDELTEKNDLLLLIGDYLKDLSVPPNILDLIYRFYINIRKEAKTTLTDGTGQCPHFSLRTLCRALSSVSSARCGTITRSLYEAMCLSFLTQLDSVSHPKVQNMISNAVLGKKNLKSVLNQAIPEPKGVKGEHFINFEGYWIQQGKVKPVIPEDYILTQSVRKNLKDLVRIISIGKLPILLQGDTSVGKTSLITYIAKVSGNHCVRINNHQHTDLQEYIGSYATDVNGKLVFREGVLVEAMRKGHWIILDELNLAPSDVLEALNRVLDDNRELFIPETQQVIKADPNFMLFATQNPPGLYGGRKLLSRAFRNRFVELHFDEIPRTELETILHERCHMPPSYCKKIIGVMGELQARRRGSAAVQGKEGFITLRDLFRWGQRYKAAADDNTAKGKYYDWDQHIADEGYLVLAGRVRQIEERVIIQQVLQKYIKRSVEPEHLFSLSDKTSSVTKDILESILNADLDEFKHVVWTLNMRRLAVLIAKSFTFNEPVLLVGETGCGKTTVCQVLAALRKCQLFSVNCHMHTEGADFLGGLRPVRNHTDDGKLFEWVDGPLVEAMKTGQLFLADEISLADDSVLERLNSLLETERQLLLAEKGIDMEDNATSIIVAHENFHFIGTMNPGGDYGKKELSPALRNRFTEIWCDHNTSRNDLIQVLEKSLCDNMKFNGNAEFSCNISSCILDFVDWFKSTKVGERFPCSIRDLLSWIHFINTTVGQSGINIPDAYIHGASLIFLDCFGTGMSGAESLQVLNNTRRAAIEFLLNQIQENRMGNIDSLKSMFLEKNPKIVAKKLDDKFGIEPFYIPYGDVNINTSDPKGKFQSVEFSFTAPTTGVNTMRLLRGLQLNKPILLEGSPGVGKTSLVMALAKVSGHRVLRMNLSDQTDISDLFGADLPTPEGSFAWQEGAFLTALQNGDWILLDELNLAPQSVLEGLNACLDHRGEVYIPELGRAFKVKNNTRIFACQNPLRQGGSRRGLPKSFLNRFTQVYVDTLLDEDLMFITSSQYPIIPKDVLQKMINMNSRIMRETSDLLWGHRGSPWEMNLRDIQRWCDGLMSDLVEDQIDGNVIKDLKPGRLAQLLYIDRMRTLGDKDKVKSIYKDIFYPEYPLSNDHPMIYVTDTHIHVGDVTIERNTLCLNRTNLDDMLVLRHQLPALKSLIQCVNMNWLAIVIGPASSGKNCCVQTLAQLVGKELNILPVVSAMDTSDLLGGFEQTDYNRHLDDISLKVERLVYEIHQKLLLKKDFKNAVKILAYLETYRFLGYHNQSVEHTMEEEVKLCIEKESSLQKVLGELSELCVDRKEVIGELSARLRHVREMVEREGSINAGGKFEWVDSLLVKCLLNGSWLLVDNVNLCSSAVLDRFNGLLEPNGVLSIPERGGPMNIIKPHPHFRMFFTMDPKNGEISRAMRNRGVEIYLLGSEEYEDVSSIEAIPDLDLSAMLSSTGLSPRYHNVFKMAHQLMCSFISNYVKPSQTHLLQAAFLTTQQVLRGESLSNSIIKSFSDVYIKCRVTTDFISMQKSVAEYKNEMLASLESFIESSFKNKNLEPALVLDHTHLSMKLYRSSSVEIVKKHSIFLKAAMKKFDYENLSHISLLLYQFYHLCSPRDLNMRYEYINHLLSYVDASEKLLSWIMNLNETLYKRIQLENEFNQDMSYPWDLQWMSEIQTDGYLLDTSLSNRVSLCLYYMAYVSSQDVLHKTNSKDVTALDYSLKVESGQMSDFSDLPLLKYCSKLLSTVDETIINILSNPSIFISTDQWCTMVILFNWRNRFYTICNEPLFAKIKKGTKTSTSLREIIIVMLNIHYKWLSKYLLGKLKQIDSTQMKKLLEILETIDRSIHTQHSPLRSLGKHLKRIMGQPTPYPNENVYKMSQHRDKYIQEMSILTHKKANIDMSDARNIINRNLSNAKIIFKNISTTFSFPDEDLSKKINSDALVDISSEFDEGDDKINIKEQDIVKEIEKMCCDIQLWPIKEYLILKVSSVCKAKVFSDLLNNLRRTVYGVDANDECVDLQKKNLMNLLSDVVSSIPGLPLKLHSILSDKSILDNFDSTMDVLLENSSEICDVMTSYIEKSPCTNPAYWIKWSASDLAPVDKSVFVEPQVKIDAVSMDFPHLTYNTIKIIYQSDEIKQKDVPESSMNMSSLHSWQGRSKELNVLHKLLWRNMLISDMKDIKQCISDAKMSVIHFERMVLSLQCALMRKDLTTINKYEDLEMCVNNCIHLIKNVYREKNIYNNIEINNLRDSIIECLCDGLKSVQQIKKKIGNLNKINSDDLNESLSITLMTGNAQMLGAYCNILLLSDVGFMDPIQKNTLKLEYINEDVNTVERLLDLHVLHNVVDGTISVSKVESETCLLWNSSKEFICTKGAANTFNKDSLYKRAENIHPHCSSFIKLKGSVRNSVNVLNKGFNYRPSEPSFIDLAKEYQHFIYTLASPSVIKKHNAKCKEITKTLLDIITLNKYDSSPVVAILNSANDVVRELTTWQASITSFYDKIDRLYLASYPDLTKTFLNVITQLSYGVTIMKNAIIKMSLMIRHGKKRCKSVGLFIEDLIRFPLIKNNCDDFEFKTDFVTSLTFADFLQTFNTTEKTINDIECFRLLKASMKDLHSACVTHNYLDEMSWDELTILLNQVVTTWQKKQKEIDKKKLEEDLLYVNKTRCEDKSEDEQFEDEVKEMFPTFSDMDFSDFKSNALEQNKPVKLSVPNAENQVLITGRDISEISTLHSQLLQSFTCSEWIAPSSNNNVTSDHLSPLLEKYNTLSNILDPISRALTESLDSKVLPSLLVFVAHSKGILDGENYLDVDLKNTGSLDCGPNFYHDSWVSETRKCLPALQLVISTTQGYLNEWPDFPTLNDIMTVANRILSFPLTSPVARYLTGLELLRDKIEEWNKSAHKGNSMIDVSLAVAQHIVSWRRLELNSWKNSLNHSYQKCGANGDKWWFHIYVLIETYVNNQSMADNPGEVMTAQQFITAMQQFMEKSSLGEYHRRLEILYTFHCHLIHMPPSGRRDEVLCILWNIHKFYTQFSEHISQVIKDKRTPIEKKLKDFVKICTWERDLSYWAVKELVEKSHRIVRKHIKEFEEVLKLSASNFLTADKSCEGGSEPVGVWDRPKRGLSTKHCYMVDPLQYVTTARTLKKYFSDDESFFKNSLSDKVVLVGQMVSLIGKAQKICKETLLMSSYPVLVQSLDGLVTTIIDTSKCLRELEVSPDLSKSKQKSQAKNFLQQKKKGLADLFKTLARIGVSYRTGLVEFNVRGGEIINFLVPPVNLKVAFEYLKNRDQTYNEKQNVAHRRSDTVLLSVWDGCDLYYQRCVARLGALTQALVAPAPDLGLNNVERCKGFAVHLMLMIQDQKVRLAKSSRYLCILRNQVTQLTALCETDSVIPSQETLLEKLLKLKEIYPNILLTMEQFKIVMKACPQSDGSQGVNTSEDIAFDVALSNSPLVTCVKFDPVWSDAYQRVKNIITICSKQIEALVKVTQSNPTVYTFKKIEKLSNTNVLTHTQVSVIMQAIENLNNIAAKLKELVVLFNGNLSQHIQNPIIQSIVSLETYIQKYSYLNNDVLSDKGSSECRSDFNSFVVKVEGVISFILLTMQEIYKKYTNVKDKNINGDTENAEENETIDEEQNEQLIVDHLRKELVNNMKEDISNLRMPQMINRIDSLMSDLLVNMECCDNDGSIYKKHILRCVPLLEQMTLLAQFFITQQVATHRVSCKMLSVLLNIFTELASKGFCTPSELGEEAGEGEGQGKFSGGMGLADGEGEKDVSERIENQDQLDDAQMPGEEKKEEKRDCKEEEKGIEMSDDFDSHLQDIEPKGEEDKDSDDDSDDDADKQMGETDTGVDKLDQQIWGSDDEEEDEEDSNQKNDKKEEKGDGKPIGEKEMGAKEDGGGEEEQVGEERDKKEKKKDINEMEEPEYDDDQVDPYHGKQQPLPEPEPMDLPDDINVDDDGEKDEEKEEDDKNPFEIDVMKDKKQELPPDENKEDKEESGSAEKQDTKGQMDGDSEDDEEEGENDTEDKNEQQESKENEDIEDGADKMDEQNPETEDIPDNLNDQDETPKQVPDENVQQNQQEEENPTPEDNERTADNEEANPSKDQPTSEDNVENSSMEKGSKDTTKTNKQIGEEEKPAPYEQCQEQEGDEKEGVGQSELSQNQQGHRGDREDRPKGSQAEREQREEKGKEKRNKPGSTQQDRALGETKEPAKKKMKMLDIQEKDTNEDEGDDDDDGVGENNDPEQEADIYQHIKKAKETDVQAIDAATKEQAENQPVPNNPEEQGQDMESDDDVAMEDENQDIEIEEALDKIEAEKVGEDKKEKNKQQNKGEDGERGEEPTGDVGMEVEGEVVSTHTVERPADTSYHTQMDIVRVPMSSMEGSGVSGAEVRQSLQSMGGRGQGGDQERGAWHHLWGSTASQARLLTERLRLVLEPTGLSRLAGDYRTGRRINMRRVIPYIASHFRKDRIWLRRTKPARREYHIAVAIDDSSSMCDNSSKELAFESLALVSQALNLLEAGELAVLSFGEEPQILHSFGDQFTESSGSKLLQNLTFEQTKTKIAKLVDFASAMFEEQCKASSAINAKLLLIVSDGRGIFSEGEEKVIQAIRRARQQGVFMVYLIVDNPDCKDSIMDIRTPVFDPQTFALKDLKPYLDMFPFPFYLILRDIAALPSVLSDALRQWFELAANVDKQ